MNILVTDPTVSPRAASARPLLRIVIVGHVDHGKSTLIGRLLHETDSLPEGRIETLRAVSARRGMPFEWSFLLDALQTERDQGITIDTSQIRFRTASRDIILIDAPGHAEFLRNMITGAAQADAALLIVDAAEGVREQTRRHVHMLHLLGVRQVAVVINKMDRIDFDPTRFRTLEAEISDQLGALGLTPTAVIPISARNGDGVARRTPSIAWHAGPTVLDALEGLAVTRPPEEFGLRLPIQAVYKFDDRRILAGRVETGRIAVGDEITIMPSAKLARVRAIEAWPVPNEAQAPREAGPGQSVGITLDREIFVDRGDVIATAVDRSGATHHLRARVFWLHDQALRVGTSLTVRVGTAETRATVTAIEKAIDPGALSAAGGTTAIAQNHIGEIELTLSNVIGADLHAANPRTGRVVLDLDGRIAGGGLVLSLDAPGEGRQTASNIVAVESAVTAGERARRFGHPGGVVWLTGLPASGKSTLARALERRLFDQGGAPVLLDGDTLRTSLNADLGFSPADRSENVRRLAAIAAHLSRSGHIAIVAAVSPFAADRAHARQIAGERFYEVHVAAPLDVCERRDPKSHYRKAHVGEIAAFTGVSAAYEPPMAPDLMIDTSTSPVTDAVAALEQLLR